VRKSLMKVKKKKKRKNKYWRRIRKRNC